MTPGRDVRKLLSRKIYFGVQAARNGVSPRLIERAGALLNSSADDLNAHIARGLYHTHAAPKADPLAWLEEQPLLTRHELARRLAAAPKPAGRVEWKRTSGSMGTPVSIPRDMEMAAWIDAVMWALYGWHGIRPGDCHARFWGTRRGLRPLAKSLASHALNRTPISAFNLDTKSALQHYERLVRRGPVYIHGYPSAISHFVDLLTDQNVSGHDVGVRVIFSTGEVLSESVRRRLEAFFSCRVVNEYGCSESGLVGFECEYGTMHAVPVTCYPEVINESGRRVPPGQVGEVVITDLMGTVAPLLRYRLHDQAVTPEPGVCECRRALVVCNLAEGRNGSFLHLPSGRKVYSSCIAYAMPRAVRSFSARQLSIQDVEILVVPEPTADWTRVESEIVTALRDHVGQELRLSVRPVAAIKAKDLSGKLRYFEPLEGPHEP
jgi:phenylacetate-CoA ligase